MQRTPEGAPCKVSAFWEGAIHKARFEPLDAAQGRRAESWRYMEAGLMVRLPYSGLLTSSCCHWLGFPPSCTSFLVATISRMLWQTPLYGLHIPLM